MVAFQIHETFNMHFTQRQNDQSESQRLTWFNHDLTTNNAVQLSYTSLSNSLPKKVNSCRPWNEIDLQVAISQQVRLR
jgi:hypothetical protein